MKDGAGDPGPVMEVRPQTLGNGENELAHRHMGNDVVHQVGRRSGHALGVARRAGSSALAGKRDEEVVPTGGASGPSEAVGHDPAFEVAPELLLHMFRYAVTHGIGLVGLGDVGLKVLPDDAVERGGLGVAPTIGLGLGAGRRPGRRRGPPGCLLCLPDLSGHRKPPASRGAGQRVSTPRTARGWGGRMAEAAASDGGRNRYRPSAGGLRAEEQARSRP